MHAAGLIYAFAGLPKIKHLPLAVVICLRKRVCGHASRRNLVKSAHVHAARTHMHLTYSTQYDLCIRFRIRVACTASSRALCVVFQHRRFRRCSGKRSWRPPAGAVEAALHARMMYHIIFDSHAACHAARAHLKRARGRSVPRARAGTPRSERRCS